MTRKPGWHKKLRETMVTRCDFMGCFFEQETLKVGEWSSALRGASMKVITLLSSKLHFWKQLINYSWLSNVKRSRTGWSDVIGWEKKGRTGFAFRELFTFPKCWINCKQMHHRSLTIWGLSLGLMLIWGSKTMVGLDIESKRFFIVTVIRYIY